MEKLMIDKSKWEKFNNIINETQKIISNEKYFLDYVLHNGFITNEERELLREIKQKNIFPIHTIQNTSRFFMISNVMNNFQLEIKNSFDLIEVYVSKSDNNKIVLENRIMDILGKTNRCIVSLNKELLLNQDNLIKIHAKEYEKNILEYINTIFPTEIEIDRVEQIKDGAVNVVNDDKDFQIKLITDFINRENIFGKLHSKFISMSQITFINCYNDFYLKFNSNLNNLSKKDIEKLDLPDIITKVNTKNTDLRTLMSNHIEQYETLMKHLQSDKDIDGKTKNVQIKKSNSSSSFEWIALEGNNHHFQKILSIFVFCNYKKWLSCNWLLIKSVDREKIILNTFGIEIKRQNLTNKKINEIEKNIKQIVQFNDDFKYLNFIKNFITNS